MGGIWRHKRISPYPNSNPEVTIHLNYPFRGDTKCEHAGADGSIPRALAIRYLGTDPIISCLDCVDKELGELERSFEWKKEREGGDKSCGNG